MYWIFNWTYIFNSRLESYIRDWIFGRFHFFILTVSLVLGLAFTGSKEGSWSVWNNILSSWQIAGWGGGGGGRVIVLVKLQVERVVLLLRQYYYVPCVHCPVSCPPTQGPHISGGVSGGSDQWTDSQKSVWRRQAGGREETWYWSWQGFLLSVVKIVRIRSQ